MKPRNTRAECQSPVQRRANHIWSQVGDTYHVFPRCRTRSHRERDRKSLLEQRSMSFRTFTNTVALRSNLLQDLPDDLLHLREPPLLPMPLRVKLHSLLFLRHHRSNSGLGIGRITDSKSAHRFAYAPLYRRADSWHEGARPCCAGLPAVHKGQDESRRIALSNQSAGSLAICRPVPV